MTSLLTCQAQSWSEVKESGKYFFGEGWGGTVEEANQEALTNLIQQFRVNISVNSQQSHRRKESNGKVADETTTFQSAINSYSQATLDSTMMLVISPAPKAHVGRWIKKTDVDKIFNGRRTKIHSLIEQGLRAEEKGKVDVALRNYYWAFTLLKSLPNCNQERYDGHTLMAWLPNQMDEVLSDVSASIEKVDNGDAEIRFTYKGKPVNSVDFSYNDGGMWSNISSAKDGTGLIYLSPGTSTENVNIQIEYEYRGQAMLDPEIQSVMTVSPEINIAKAFLNAKKSNTASIVQNSLQPASSHLTTNNISAPSTDISSSFTDIEPEFYAPPKTLSDVETLGGIMERIAKSIKTKNNDNLRELFTPEGYSVYNKLIRYGQAKVVGDTKFEFTRSKDNIFGRGLQLAFSFRNGVRKNFVEDIVFTFNKDNLISNVSLGLGKTTLDDILGQSAYPEEVRMQLVQFLENYQTAFALKRLDYISTIFDEDAIIIVGTEVKRPAQSQRDGGYAFADNKFIKYNRYDKQSYLEKLKLSFASKEFINLRFNSTQVRKAFNGGELYGIQIEQDYYSSNYGDHGYLFLEINLNNPAKPLILVRTWQPHPDPEFGVYNESLFPVHSFE